MVGSRYTSIKTRIETAAGTPTSSASATLATLPSKQGLKQYSSEQINPDREHSRYTSIKTRIETRSGGWENHQGCTSRYTSIKTRIETHPALHFPTYGAGTLATLPSKQGLKLGWGATFPRNPVLSLHFHQNKD